MVDVAHDANVAALITFANGIEVTYQGTWAANRDSLDFNWRTDCARGIAVQADMFGALSFALRDDPAPTPVALPPHEPWISDATGLSAPSSRISSTAPRSNARAPITSKRSAWWRRLDRLGQEPDHNARHPAGRGAGMATPPNRHSPNREKEHRMRPITPLLWAGTASLALVCARLRPSPPKTPSSSDCRADITTFEPANISSRDNANIARHIFGTLYTISGDGAVTPDLAENLEISEDGLNYVYTLREGLTCHDGEALTAEDVAYTFNRAKDPANQFTGNTPGFVFSSIGFQSAEALDDRRVQINIERKNPIAFGLIAEVYVHCKDSYEKMTLDEAAANPVGSGPYRLASWTRGSEVVLEKVENPNSPANMQGSSGGSSPRHPPGRPN